MIYAGILAGGTGSRMGKVDLPKQFMLLGNKPIIIHTLEQFILSPQINQIIIAVPENWLTYTEDIIKKYIIDTTQIAIITGGETRNETILNICKHIEKNNKITDEDIIITHDSVRPFITQRIICDNITKLQEGYDAADTVVKTNDTIIEALDDTTISSIPDRHYLYNGQTPQSFSVKQFMNLYNSLSAEEKNILTDACKIFVLKGKKVALVAGEDYNIKITTPFDLTIANLMINEDANYDKPSV